MSYLYDGNITWRNQEGSCSSTMIQIHYMFKSGILLEEKIVILLHKGKSYNKIVILCSVEYFNLNIFVCLFLSKKVWEPDKPKLWRRWRSKFIRVQDGDQEVSVSPLCITSSLSGLIILKDCNLVEF